MEHVDGYIMPAILAIVLLNLFIGDWFKALFKLIRPDTSPSQVVDTLQKLADLRTAGTITEAQFADLKRRCIARLGEPSLLPSEPLNTPIGHLEKLAQLKDEEILTEAEFASQRVRLLRFEAPPPSPRDIAGIAHIEKLHELLDEEMITREEFEVHKREILEGTDVAAAKPARAWSDDLDEP